MSKTQSLEIECESAIIKPGSNKVVIVNLDGPTDIDNLLSQIDSGEMVGWISRNLNPEDIFPSKQLAQWAEYEGYVKE